MEGLGNLLVLFCTLSYNLYSFFRSFFLLAEISLYLFPFEGASFLISRFRDGVGISR